MRVLGLDVAKSSVAACLLTEMPKAPREFYYECQFHRFNADTTGVTTMLLMRPDVVILEPTGTNYSKLWLEHLLSAGVEVRFVDHKSLRSYRENHLALPDKDDDADSLALACYQFDYGDSPQRFVKIRDQMVMKIREIMLRLSHLNRVQSPIINRLRQDLAWQFPEVMSVRSIRGDSGNVPLLWGWIAGERESTRYTRMYKETIGLGLTSTAKFHAQRICNLQREEQELEEQLAEIMGHHKFAPYREVFSKFEFGDRLEAILISQIFPFENYLGDDGKPEVKIRKGRKSGKATKRHLSLRRFQKALGCAPSMEASGDISRSKVAGGSALCRKSLWQWVFSAVEPSHRRANSIIKELGEFLDAEKAAGRPVKLARSRVSAKAVKLLFRELVKELVIEATSQPPEKNC